ncbi:endonuclease/exonuclease/phosphatase family protein [Polaribacter sp. R2A056_3_33]|uniref:endonuclease/exonuclease/phosphatase family protein n=1 Tax=Polaribacter sp. R2A056_3_33 TaxID=2745563 RepID=UPI001C4E9279|nr:endonuclease/exonuclease/phosphatase family protein [Polaribacter sp. R2A056_3_33]QXP71258.1 endonuclease/exonuclease/phosphatase family protein [Polaribacter sp. R2A056_3_33]
MVQKISILFIPVLILFLFSCTSGKKKETLHPKEKSAKNVSLSKDLLLSETKKRGVPNSLRIVTWNIRDLGRTKNAEEIIEIAKILRNFDLVAIQEVAAKDPAGAQAVAKIVDELNRMGSKWDYQISNPTKSPSVYMSERYAILWKTSKVSILEKAYLDKDLEDKCFREPFIGKFKLKKGKTPFYVVNFHSRKHNDHPEEEIKFLKDYPKRLNTNNIFIVGDFNLNERHKVWDDLYGLGFKSAVKNKKTTLKMACKKDVYLNHSIDNIYYNSSEVQIINSNHLDFVKTCDNLKTARMLSDHLPVFLECIID